MEYICPHCNEFLILSSINCGIIRHAIFKSNYEQVPPHLEQKLCEELVELDLVFGCCKPSRIVDGKLEKCDYI